MRHLNGMETVRQIREYDKSVAAIFTTTGMDYAVESYDVRAYGYLLKPVEQEKVEEAINRYMEERYPRVRQSLLMISGSSGRRIAYDDILYIESRRMNLRIVCSGGEEYAIRKKIEGEGNLPVNKPVSGITLDRAQITLLPGDNSGFVMFDITPEGATNKNVIVTSSNEAVVHASVGANSENTICLYAKSEESATVTVKTEDGGYTASCKVTVSENAKGNTFTLSIGGMGGSMIMSEHAEGEIVAIDAGTKSGYKFISWKTKDPSVKFANKNSAKTSFVMPDRDVVIEAAWEKNQSTTPDKPGSSAAWSRREDGTWTATVGAGLTGNVITLAAATAVRPSAHW